MHSIARLMIIGLLAAQVSCAREEQITAPRYEVVTDVRQTMEWIIDPAADLIWGSAGSVITEGGEQDLAPATPKDWAKVEAAAAMLAGSGNLLMLPGRSAGPDWNARAGDLIDAGRQAMGAARRQDADALFAAGGRLYEVCLACHEQYLVDGEAP